MHIYIGFFTKHLTAVAFQPKSGGRIQEATAFLKAAPEDSWPKILDELDAWPATTGSDWQAANGVWAPSVLYGTYGLFEHKPPWKEEVCRDPLTTYWLLGDPSPVDTGPITGPVQECVKRISQLQDVLGRLQR